MTMQTAELPIRSAIEELAGWSKVTGLLLLLLAVGCATTKPQPGTGDISFRLVWLGEADLDLHVTDPLGWHAGFTGGYSLSVEELEARRLRRLAEQRGEGVAPIGVLDVDCNAGPDRMCKRPIENLYWREETAPRGAYEVWVVLFREPPAGDPVEFTIEVRHGETVVESFSGSLEQRFENSKHFRVLF